MVIYSTEYDYFSFGQTEERPLYFYINEKVPEINMWLQYNLAVAGSEIFKEIRGF